MIHRVGFRNFKALRDVTVDLDGLTVVVGPNASGKTMRECWVLAGFEPQNDAERRRLDALRRDLGFDPREKSHLLKAGHPDDKRRPKTALRILTDGNADREGLCWCETDLDVLRRRGQQNGLADYLADARTRLVPLFSTPS